MTTKGFRYRDEPKQVTGLQLLSDLACFDGRFSSYSLTQVVQPHPFIYLCIS